MGHREILRISVGLGLLAARTRADVDVKLHPEGCVAIDTTTADDTTALQHNSPKTCADYCSQGGNSFIAVSQQFCSCWQNAPKFDHCYDNVDNRDCYFSCPAPFQDEFCGGADQSTFDFLYNFFNIASPQAAGPLAGASPGLASPTSPGSASSVDAEFAHLASSAGSRNGSVPTGPRMALAVPAQAATGSLSSLASSAALSSAAPLSSAASLASAVSLSLPAALPSFASLVSYASSLASASVLAPVGGGSIVYSAAPSASAPTSWLNSSTVYSDPGVLSLSPFSSVAPSAPLASPALSVPSASSASSSHFPSLEPGLLGAQSVLAGSEGPASLTVAQGTAADISLPLVTACATCFSNGAISSPLPATASCGSLSAFVSAIDCTHTFTCSNGEVQTAVLAETTTLCYNPSLSTTTLVELGTTTQVRLVAVTDFAFVTIIPQGNASINATANLIPTSRVIFTGNAAALRGEPLFIGRLAFGFVTLFAMAFL